MGVSAGQVSYLCAALDEKVRKFREGPLAISVTCEWTLRISAIITGTRSSFNLRAARTRP